MLKCGLNWLSPALVSAALYCTFNVLAPVVGGTVVGGTGVFVRVRVGVTPPGVLVRVLTLVAVRVRVRVAVGPPGVLVRVRVGVRVAVAPTGVLVGTPAVLVRVGVRVSVVPT